MKNKVFVFGDCHTARVWEHYDYDNSEIDLRMWGKGGIKIYDLNFDEYKKENLISSGMESTPSKLSFDPIVKFNEFENSDLLVFWLGYIDIRQFLSKYKNPEFVANYYIETLANSFGDKKIGIIEPLPQFTEMLLKHKDISPSYEYKDRKEQNDLFLKYLREFAKNKNIPILVSQDEIYEAVGKKEFTSDMTHTKAPHPVDGLKDEYNKCIYDLFAKNIIKYFDH